MWLETKMNLCDPSNKSYRAAVSHGIVYAVQGDSNF